MTRDVRDKKQKKKWLLKEQKKGKKRKTRLTSLTLLNNGLEFCSEIVNLWNSGGEEVEERERRRRFCLPTECCHDEKLPLKDHINWATVIRVVCNFGSSHRMRSLQFTGNKQCNSGDHLNIWI
ncbi:hypothetical protein GCK72_005241 [Caenorhabditis remanei]|uniref:Uncharacterized protein n=1 Tax=Caenorhabditis remanei TaxID=31234 RepID=A0A6A5HE06_CAERE|nr:hypothetical protein GCK72_005241 [Caenorhabditis remanei]KAF1765289.1 hypothetical protein GCK72_005241 [Caenorhabditis remanei]